MGCSGSKATVTSSHKKLVVKPRPKMDFKDENLQFYFRYEFNDGVS